MAEFEKPSNTEEEYFAREEIEKKRKLALQQQAALETMRREELKTLHWMKCPKCGLDLYRLEEGKVEIETCFNCHGIWLDKGELEQIVKAGSPQSGAVMRAVLNLFQRK